MQEVVVVSHQEDQQKEVNHQSPPTNKMMGDPFASQQMNDAPPPRPFRREENIFSRVDGHSAPQVLPYKERTGNYGTSDAQVSDTLVNSLAFNNITWSPPLLDKRHICQSLHDFENYCQIVGVPLFHKRRLLLEEFKRCCQETFSSFLRTGNNSYEGLKHFLLIRFETVANVHKIRLDPPWITTDAYSQFTFAVELYEKTPPEEFVKFFVLRTSPVALQAAMEGFLNLPYNDFFRKYKSKLAEVRKSVAPHNRRNYNQLRGQKFEAGHDPFRENIAKRPQDPTPYGNNLCFYHRQFKENARNCSLNNCDMKHLVPQASSKFEQYLSKNERTRGEN